MRKNMLTGELYDPGLNVLLLAFAFLCAGTLAALLTFAEPLSVMESAWKLLAHLLG